MDRARRIAADPLVRLPAAVIADRQTGGRGRRGAAWWQPTGSLAASLVVDGSAVAGGVTPTWSLACGVALAETIRDLEPAVAARVRWPNDVEVAGRKLAGILVETAADGRAVFGVGVNTSGRASDAPEPLRDRVITLPDVTGRTMPRQRLLAALVPRLLDMLGRLAAEPRMLGRRYRPLCSLTGSDVRVFVGDTMFMPDVGTARCDFPGGDAKNLYASVRKILSLPPPTRLFMCHDYQPNNREVAFETTVAEQREKNIHVHDGISEDQFVEMRIRRDATLEMPVLILPAVQINIRAGEMPPKESNGIAYVKIPLNAL